VASNKYLPTDGINKSSPAQQLLSLLCACMDVNWLAGGGGERAEIKVYMEK
jgi:hypothetical protein